MSRFSGVLVAGILSVAIPSASAVVVMAAENSQQPKPAGPAAPSCKPFIIDNPDGTFTIQKGPAEETSKDPKVQSGLVIPPQIVVPFASGVAKKSSGRKDAGCPC